MTDYRKYNLHLFDGNTNLTTSPDLSEEMKTYYSDYLIDNAEPNLVHDKFGQKQPIPKGGGKTIQFRKYDALPVITTEIQEGVTPDGQKLTVGIVEATVKQYGGYIELSDMLLATAIDNNLVMATKLLGSQAGKTLDAITRDVITAGGAVQYHEGEVLSRHDLVGGQEEGNHYLTVRAIKNAVRTLKRQNAEKIDGSYIAIIHPDVSNDLTDDPNWMYPHQYQDTSNIYEGEIGKLHGVRFVETTEAKIFEATPLAKKDLFVTADVTDSNAIQFTVSSDVSNNSLVGKWVYVGDNRCYIGSNTMQMMQVYTDETMATEAKMTVSKGTPIYSADAGKYGADVYATLIIGANAYGVTEITGGGLQHIVKQLGSAGSADPLNQRATAGWKATKTAVVLSPQYMVRIETTSSYNK